MSEKKCKYCAMQIPNEAKICPYCRKKLPKHLPWWVSLIVICFVFYSCSKMFSETSNEPISSTSDSAQHESVKTSKTNKINSSKSKVEETRKWKGSPATEKDYDNVTTYATIIGRAVACGENISEPSKRVGTWMDRTFSTSEKSTQVQVYATAIEYAATQQQLGESPDSCPSAIRAFQKTRWP